MTLVQSSTNGGFGAAINRGAALATEPWLLILNSDVRLSPGFLSRACSEAGEWQPAVCGFRQMAPTGPEPAAGPFPTLLSTATLGVRTLAFVVRRRGWSIRTVHVPVTSGSVDWLVASALLVPRTAFEAVGGFDERFFMYLEEVDLQRRLRLAGVRSVLLTDLTVDHDHGSSSQSVDIPVEQLRSQLVYIAKWEGHARLRALVWLMEAGIVLDFGADVARRVSGRDVRPLTAARHRWSRLHEARRIPAGRVRASSRHSHTTE